MPLSTPPSDGIPAPLYNYVLLDLSGTLHIGDQPTNLACRSLSRLLAAGVTVRFLTNTSKTSRSSLLSQLRSIGFGPDVMQESDIMTGNIAGRDYLRAVSQSASSPLRPYYLVSDDALPDFDVSPSSSSTSSSSSSSSSSSPSSYNAVVVAYSPSSVNYKSLSFATRVLLQPSCETFVAVHAAPYVLDPSCGNEVCVGPGFVVAGLEAATGKKCVVTGKPTLAFFEAALRDMGADESRERVVMIGDDISADVGGAATAGVDSFLVKTGKFREKDLTSKELRTKYFKGAFNDFAACVDYILGGTEDELSALRDQAESMVPMTPNELRMAEEIRVLRAMVSSQTLSPGYALPESSPARGGAGGGGAVGRKLFPQASADPAADLRGGRKPPGEVEAESKASAKEVESKDVPRSEGASRRGGASSSGSSAQSKEGDEGVEAAGGGEIAGEGAPSDGGGGRKSRKSAEKKEAAGEGEGGGEAFSQQEANEAEAMTLRLQRFYNKWDPSKLDGVSKLVKKKLGQQEELFGQLVAKYGPEP